MMRYRILTALVLLLLLPVAAPAQNFGGIFNSGTIAGITFPLTVPNGGTGATTLTGIVKGSGAGALTPASAGSDYTSPTGTENLSSKTITASSLAISDYQYIPIDAGMDSVIAAPDAAIRVQGAVGSTIAPTPANVTYSTFTPSGANITTAVWGSGTQTATITIATLTAGKLYRLQFTPTVTGQVPTFTATSGIGVSVIPTVVTAVVETIYFRASATTAVFTATNTGASTWSTASTTCFEYTRPAIAREFSNATQQSLVFDWKPPADWNAGTITFVPYGVVTNATAPTTGQTVVWSLTGFCTADSGSLSQALGTAVTSTLTAPATYVQYDEWIAPETAALTLPGAAAGSVCRIVVDRLTSGSYAQKTGLVGGLLKFTRTLAP
jgi:hypothetical protein